MKHLLVSVLEWVKNFLKTTFHARNENLPYYVSMLVAGVPFIVALNVFVELTDELAENELGFFDQTVTNFVLSLRSPALTNFFAFTTHLGDRFAYIIISALLAIYFFIRHSNWKFIAQTIMVLALSTLSNVVLKKVINRPRPDLEHLVAVDTLSYPSGHAMSAMAFYGFLIYLFTLLKMQRFVRISLIAVWVLIILCVGASRIYLSVHYPSDVAAGFAGGLIWVTFCIILFNLISLWRRRRQTPGALKTGNSGL